MRVGFCYSLRDIKRNKIWVSLFIGLGFTQALSFLIASGIPLLIFVPAGIEHRFENFTDDFSTWVIFYGPAGGEKDTVA